jgi:hypothetical protein
MSSSGILPRHDGATIAYHRLATRGSGIVFLDGFRCDMIGAVGGAAHLAALRMRDKLTCVAVSQLNIGSDEARFANGRIFAPPTG